MTSLLCEFVVLLLFWSSTALALDPARPVTQYGHNAWRVQDGAFGGAPSSLIQTTDGYLWMGTRSGLYRFDGVRFAPFTGAATGERIRSPTIAALVADPDGSLWFGTGADLEHWHDGILSHFPAEPGYVMGLFLDIYQAKDGTIWSTRFRKTDTEGPVCKVAGSGVKCYGERDGVTLNTASSSMFEDAEGNLWTHSDHAIIHWDPKGLKALSGGMVIKNGADSVQCILPDAHGSILVGLGPGGLWRLVDGALEPYKVGGLDGAKIDARQLLVDSRGSLWIGTEGQGLFRVNSADRVDHYGSKDGLSSDTVTTFAEDHEGNIWVGTSEGVDRLRDVPVISYSAREGLSGELVNGVLASHDGTVWINNIRSLDALRDGTVTSLKTGQALPGALITALFEDRGGHLFVGVDDEMLEYDGRTFAPIVADGQAHLGRFQALAQDRDGTLWAALGGGGSTSTWLLHIENGRVREKTGQDILPLAPVGPLAADPVGGVWLSLTNNDLVHWRAGSSETVKLGRPAHGGSASGLTVYPDGTVYVSSGDGLIGWRKGVVRRMTAANGIPCQGLVSMLAGDDDLWLAGECGYFKVANDELQRWWSHPDAALHFTLFDTLDGAQVASPGFFPRASRAPDGKLWWANHSILQMIDPHARALNQLPPPVRIERVIADRRIHETPVDLHLPPLTRDLEIDYTALSFVMPAKVHFQYRLVGHDDAWLDVQTRRQAYYTDLKPGSYRFQVKAANNDGVWNETPATLDLQVAPLFYQTRVFLAICVILGLALLYVAYLVRIRHVADRMRLRMQTQSRERERIARDLHDTLLQGVQALIYRFDSLAEKLPAEYAERGDVQGALDHAEALLAEGRDKVFGMRTGAASGDLTEALTAAAHSLESQSECRYAVRVQGRPAVLASDAREELYRIGVEALTNVYQHAAATLVEVDLTYQSSGVTLRIRDDGKGFDVHTVAARARQGHFGLIGLRERAQRLGGDLTIVSSAGAGCEIRAHIPADKAYVRTRTPIRRWLQRLWQLEEGVE